MPGIEELRDAVADEELAALFVAGAGFGAAAFARLGQVLFQLAREALMMSDIGLELGGIHVDAGAESGHDPLVIP